MESLIGADELKRVYQPNLAAGTALAVALNTVAIGAAVEWSDHQRSAEEPLVISSVPSNSPSPFVLARALVEISEPGIPPSFGVPVPVPDEQVSGEFRAATVEEWTSLTMPEPLEGGANSQRAAVMQKMPKLVKAETPAYPNVALADGLEGTVWVRALVGADGKVREAGISRRSRLDIGFESAAVEAALHNIYEPAIDQSGQPAATWIDCSVEFKLERSLRL